MDLPRSLIKEFAKSVKTNNKKPPETTAYGTIVKDGNSVYVSLDGSETLTPITTTADVISGERVIVTIKNHTATVTGNLSSPSARTDDVKEVAADVLRVDHVLSHKVTTEELVAVNATIEHLQAKLAEFDSLSTEDLEAVNADIEKLKAKYADIEYLSAGDMEAINADIENLRVKIGTFEGLSAEDLEAVNAEIENLEAENAKFVYVSADKLEASYAEIGTLKVKQGEFEKIVADQAEFNKVIANDIEANHAYIEEIESLVVDAETGNFKFANIDFSNIGKAAMEYFYAQSGLIKDVKIGDATIAGELIGVTIKGDLIEGGTVKADKLVILGENGLYYKLNVNGETVETEQTEYNSLDGKHILAKSITASKITVKDLVAFGATIGGFTITDDSLHSDVKESVDNYTVGAYLDSKGQFNFGDANSYLMGYIDEEDNYKIVLKAHDIILRGTNVSIETEIDNVKKDVDSLRDEITTLLHIESSRGLVFKNNGVSTILSVVIYHGNQRITDSETMKKVFGNSAYLEWKWQRLDEDSYGIISASDSRFMDNGFKFVLSPDDVDAKIDFMCDLIV